MIKLSEETRKVFRAIFRGVGTVTASLSLGACPYIYNIHPETPSMYGPGPDIIREEIFIQGQVKNKQTGDFINNITVYIESENFNYTSQTYYEGNFYFYVPVNDSYTIIFTDIDGDKNGKYKQLERNITKEEAQTLHETPLVIELEEKTDEV